MSRFIPIGDVIDDLCLRSGDLLRRNKGLYLSCAEDTWQDLNESTIRIAKRLKMPVRRMFTINKRTNSIDMPCDFLRLSSVNVVDECGIIYPVYRNLNVHNDIVEVPAEKNCACEFNCGHKLCNLIKGYEAIQTTVSDTLPDGTPVSFNAICRKAVDKNGFLYEENQFIERVYTAGVWTNTILQTENKKLCECEVDHNGCIKDTEHNIKNACDHCGIRNFNSNICIGGNASCPPEPGCDEWIYYCDNKMDWFTVQCGCSPCGMIKNNVYNIGDTGDRLVFPANFGFDKVLVRYYEDIELNKLQVPYIAKETFMKGLQYFAANNNDKKVQLAAAYGQQYSRLKWGLFLELNKYRSVELGNAISPRAFIPSYVDHREDRWFGYY